MICLLLIYWESDIISVLEFHFQLEAILVTYGPKDTFLDIVFDLVGAVLVLAFGDRILGELAVNE